MRHFCAGAEVQSFGITTVIHTDKEKFSRFLDVMENVPVPTVAALNRGILGGGVELALTCDMILAADTAYLGQVEVAVGLHPLLGGTQRLVARVVQNGGMTQKRQCHARESGHPDLAARAGALDSRFRGNDTTLKDLILNDARD